MLVMKSIAISNEHARINESGLSLEIMQELNEKIMLVQKGLENPLTLILLN